MSEAERVSGVVVAAHVPLLSKLSQRACVYWDVRAGLKDHPREVGHQDFWIESEGGRVLVVAPHMRVDALAERRKQLLAVAEMDLAALAVRLREMKVQMRAEQGAPANALRREHERLATVATFLLATRAHARGKIHCAGSASAQEEWIQKHSAVAVGVPGAVTASMTRDAWEVVIEAGQRVTVVGPVTTEAIPPDLAAGFGYRSLLTGRVMRGSDDAPLIVTGVGGIAPREVAKSLLPAPRPARLPMRIPSIPAVLALAFFAAVAMIVWSGHCGK